MPAGDAFAPTAGADSKLRPADETGAVADEVERLVANRTAELRAHEQELRNQNILFNAALTNMSQGLIMFDAQGRVVICNRRYLDMYGMSETEVFPGCTLAQLLRVRQRNGSFDGDPEQYARDVLARMAATKSGTRIVELSDGRTIAISNQPMPTGGWVATHEDITQRRQAEKQIAHMARHDALTDLPNRARLREWLTHALTHSHRGRPLAVLHLDLDHFMTLNDSLGHPIGDELLRAVADRLRISVGDGDLVARLGGDEFAIALSDAGTATDVSAVATRICDAIKAPYEIAGHAIIVDASVGIALAPDDGNDADALIKNADLALSRAKLEGRGTFRFFEADMDARMQARRRIELGLKTALPRDEFELFYQPIVNLRTNQITSFEALLRWRHPERGLILPAEFVPIAEDIGLISTIGEWVILQACREAATWPNHLKVAINLSPTHLSRANIASLITGALATARLPASRLELEVTEAVLMHATDATVATLHQLREMGVRIALDDFGTGYSSLSYLRSFPFDKLKIDRAFIKDIDETEKSVAIIRAIAMLADALSVTTTAEGVETELQLQQVRAVGFTEMQGFLFSPPLPGAMALPTHWAATQG
jgi:diguanylate cyclase (GGDEF)-like protein/PAS domain S-box-containing protein